MEYTPDSGRTRPMKSAVLLALIAALALTGCQAGSGPRARIREKSAAFAALPPAQQAKIEKGIVEVGFSQDMVYMALGRPNDVHDVTLPEGRETTWTYRNVIPPQTMNLLMVNPTGQTRAQSRPGLQYPSSSSISSTGTKGAPAPSVDAIPDPAVETLHVIFLNGVVFELKVAR